MSKIDNTHRDGKAGTTAVLGRRIRLSDINGLSFAVVALGATIVSASLSEARFQAVDAELARVAAVERQDSQPLRYCHNQTGTARYVSPNS